MQNATAGKHRALRGRARRIADALAKAYPDAACSLGVSNPFETLVATILSAQCTDAKVNAVAPALFRAWPDAAALARAPQRAVEAVIRPLGLFRHKARHIRACARCLVEEHGGAAPEALEALVRLPGVGRKTAHCVRVNAFGLPGLMTDTHFCRIMPRLGLTDEEAPEKIERDLAALLPPRRWGAFSHQVIRHGRVCCHARRPDCPVCPLLRLCPTGQERKKKRETE